MNPDEKNDFSAGSGSEAEIEESTALGDEETDQGKYISPEQALRVKRIRRANPLMPSHAAGNTGSAGLLLKRGHGRPRKVESMPAAADLQYHAMIAEDKAHHVETDPLVQAAIRRSDPISMLHLLKLEVCKEASAIEFQRLENEKYGKDTSQISSRRIDALTKIANLELEIRKLGAGSIDLKNERFQRVFKYWIEKIQEVAANTLPPEQIDLFFNNLSTAMDGWEDYCAEMVGNTKDT